MKDNRYQELKKENNEILNHLSPSYQTLANIYIKKARGYACKTIDTELKIQDVLKLLDDYALRNVPLNIVVPSQTEFIESNISNLSKQVKDPNRYKTIIWLTIIITLIVAWFVISIYMKSETPNQSPQNLTIEEVETNEIKISWDENMWATEGYYVWYVDSNNQKYGKYSIKETEFKFKIDKNLTYTIYVQTIKTEYFGESDESSITYPNINVQTSS